MGLVRSVAFRYRDLGLPVEDLVQEGAIGLLTAIDEYDSSSRRELLHLRLLARACRSHARTHSARPACSECRVQCSNAAVKSRVRGTRLAAAGSRANASIELAETTALSPSDVAEALAPATVASLDQPADGGTPLGELITS